MSDPIAYFITWRTYGTWLHGDERGSVDDEHNGYSTELLAPDPARRRWEENRCRQVPVVLDEGQRIVVEAAIREHARFKQWELLGLAVRSNHVHVILRYPGIPAEQVLTECKAWATRSLRRAEKVRPGAKTWAVHGSTRYVWKESELIAPGRYVVEGQDVAR